jgi:hypothetical protein
VLVATGGLLCQAAGDHGLVMWNGLGASCVPRFKARYCGSEEDGNDSDGNRPGYLNWLVNGSCNSILSSLRCRHC